MTILVVDDEEDIVDLISFNLEREGYQVICAGTGEEALELLKTKRPGPRSPLDLMLPGMQGLEAYASTFFAGPRRIRTCRFLLLDAKGTEADRVLRFSRWGPTIT